MLKASVLLVTLSGCFMLVPRSPGTTSTSGQQAQPAAYGSQPPSYGEPASYGSTSSSEPPARAQPAAPTTVSVTLRSACSKTVKVFYGAKPGFSSGTQSSISSNSVSNKTFRPGDQMWLLDDGGRGIAGVTIDDRTRQVEVTSGCASLSAR